MKTTKARRSTQERAHIYREYLRLVAPKDRQPDLTCDEKEEIVSMIKLNRIMSGQFPTSVAAEAERHIAELRGYLAEHPSPSTHQGQQTKRDREIALARWLRLADTERSQ